MDIVVYSINEAYIFDRAKSERNRLERGIAFERVAGFYWDGARVAEDTRRDYGERRYQAVGLIGDRLHVLVFTRRERLIRVISLRKANEREVKEHEAKKAQS